MTKEQLKVGMRIKYINDGIILIGTVSTMEYDWCEVKWDGVSTNHYNYNGHHIENAVPYIPDDLS